MNDAERSILVVVHARRDDTVAAAQSVASALRAAGARPVLSTDDREELGDALALLGEVATLGVEVAVEDIELAIVLGGDGTILRAAELVREGTAPVLGINMGHVGFLAEIERDDMDYAVRRAIARDYAVEERLALQVRVKDASDEVIFDTWALNEATVEKASRERMLEVVIEIDGRPLSSFGCDGVVVSTPTGSTAYNFSAGGAGDLAHGRGDRSGAAVGACAVREAARRRSRARGRDRGARAHERHRRAVVRWSSVARPAARRPCGGAALGPGRCGWPVCTLRRSPTVLVRKFRLPVQGWRGPASLTTGVIGQAP